VSGNIHPLPELSPDLSPERRQRIVKGAAVVFVRDGYEGASMSRIAAVANVSKGTLYNYFPSKQALFAAFVRERCEKLVEEVFGEPPASARVDAELKRIGLVMLNLMVSADGLALFRVVVMEAVKFPELAQSFFNAGPKVMVSRMAEWLTRQSEAGALRVADPFFAAEQFFALTQARIVMRARTDASYNATQGEIEMVVDGAVRVFLAAHGNTTLG
jgi:TetR/AcrR family transcriptional repressor of mexJK operon